MSGLWSVSIPFIKNELNNIPTCLVQLTEKKVTLTRMYFCVGNNYGAHLKITCYAGYLVCTTRFRLLPHTPTNITVIPYTFNQQKKVDNVTVTLQDLVYKVMDSFFHSFRKRVTSKIKLSISVLRL